MIYGKSYYISGMTKNMWSSNHPKYGQPNAIAGKYLGSLKGNRIWHGFEIWLNGEEIGCIFMNNEDLNKLKIEEIK